jgi:DNA-binding CsgD family transcriptional regulator/tetratricopeptide (TPR) repeat protein
MLLEREMQLGSLESMVANMKIDGGKVVLIRGEAGIGKSSLVAEFLRRIGDTAHVLFGSCDDLLTPQTLGAFWEISRVEPSIEVAVQSDDSRALQGELLDLLSRRLRPTVLAIEDTQWADEATLDMIRFLGRRIGRTNGLMVLTYRDTEVDSDHPLRQVIGELQPSRVARIPLEPLTLESVEAIVGDHELDAAEVLRQTDGNPLYVSELVAWGSGDVPVSIQDLVIARASRVSGEARELLELVSVVPGVTSERLVESIAGTSEAAMKECELAGLLRTTAAGVSFVHELQRRAMQEALPPQRRRDLNRQALEALGPDADPALFVHYAREAGLDEAVRRYAPLAARAAVTAGSRREAVAHFRLLEPYIETMNPHETASLLSDWAQQEFYLHDDRALDLVSKSVDAHRASGDLIGLAKALSFSARVNMQHLQTEAASKDAEEAVSILEPFDDDVALASALATLAYVTWLYEEDISTALAIADRALVVAERSGDPWVTIQALTWKGNMEYSVGSTQGMQLLERAHALASTIGDRDSEVRTLQNMTAMSADFRHMAQATDYARRAIETAARYEMGFVEAQTRAIFSELLLWQGKWSEVEDMATSALGTHPSAENIAWRVLGSLQARRGRREARTALEQMWELAKNAAQLTVVDPAAGALAEFLWLTGTEDQEWLSALDDILAEGTNVGSPWPSGALAFWMWKLGRLDEAPEGVFDMYAWIIRGDVDKAIAFWSERGIPYEHALALMHGTPSQRLQALRIAEDLQADALAARIRADMIASGVTPPRGRGRATREHIAGLTARQSEVLELLAEGLTNAQVADQLFLSPRTVENHVAAILLKLDVSSRDAAVSTAHDQAIL